MRARRIALFDADSPGALAALASLGPRGVPIDVYSHRRYPPGRASRYCARFERSPNLFDIDRFLPWLKYKVRAGDIDLVLPTSDLVAWYASRVNGTDQAVEESLFKDKFDLDLGPIKTPKTWTPSSLEDAHEIADALEYPIVYKPRSHVATPWARGGVAESAADLHESIERWELHPGARSLLKKFPCLDLPIFQPKLRGQFLSVSGLVVAGEPVVASACVKAAQWPPGTGIGLIFRALHAPELVAAGAAAAATCLDTAIFELELVRDEGETLWAIDLNPRMHGQIRLDIARGFDLPWLWFQAMTGETVTPPTATRDDLEWRHTILLGLTKTFGVDDKGAHKDSKPHWIDAVFDKDDPGAGALYAAQYLRHPRGLLRTFTRQRRNLRAS